MHQETGARPAARVGGPGAAAPQENLSFLKRELSHRAFVSGLMSSTDFTFHLPMGIN